MELGTRPLRLTLLAAACAIVGCSGGGGGSDGATTASTGTGRLSVSLMDAPVDDVTEVHVQIAAIWVKPVGEGPAVQLPLANAPVTVDLLEHTAENAALLIDDATLPAGDYEWLAMDVNAAFDNIYDSYVMTQTGGQEEIRVPSSRIRLVDGFEVGANQSVELLFDWDLRKALVDPPGQPGFLLKPAFRMLDVTEYAVLAGTVDALLITEGNDPAVDPSTCLADGADPLIGNSVYIFAGLDVEPDDIDGTDDPVATVAVELDGTDYRYRTSIAPGDYTLAFTCQAANDLDGDETDTDDEILFFEPISLTIPGDFDDPVDFTAPTSP